MILPLNLNPATLSVPSADSYEIWWKDCRVHPYKFMLLYFCISVNLEWVTEQTVFLYITDKCTLYTRDQRYFEFGSYIRSSWVRLCGRVAWVGCCGSTVVAWIRLYMHEYLHMRMWFHSRRCCCCCCCPYCRCRVHGLKKQKNRSMSFGLYDVCKKGKFLNIIWRCSIQGTELWKVDLWKCGRQNFFHFTAFSRNICAYRHTKASRNVCIYIYSFIYDF